mmetsp:Transcript_17527/g.23671  ORF Transcript_17527/g.23671 Transcript_17527/m.23671 type:complete len:125 (+) Transcript_17527:33-407(+)
MLCFARLSATLQSYDSFTFLGALVFTGLRFITRFLRFAFVRFETLMTDKERLIAFALGSFLAVNVSQLIDDGRRDRIHARVVLAEGQLLHKSLIERVDEDFARANDNRPQIWALFNQIQLRLLL